jgi:hypothetical protein
MIEFIVAVDPRPNTKARHFVSVAQALDRGLVRPCCHARKRDRFSAHRKPQKVLDRLGLLRHVAPPFTHFFPRRAQHEALMFLSGRGRKTNFTPGSHVHGLAFGAALPEEQRNHPVACPCSSAQADSGRRVVYLGWYVAGRYLDLCNRSRAWRSGPPHRRPRFPTMALPRCIEIDGRRRYLWRD